jgi:hypothetical protein
MASRFVNIDRDTRLLLPPDLRDWVPADHLAHFILDAVEALDLRQNSIHKNEKLDRRRTGKPENTSAESSSPKWRSHFV